MMCSEKLCREPVYRRHLCREHFLGRYRNPIDGIRQPKAKPTGPLVVYAWYAPDGTCHYVGRGTAARPMQHKFSAWWTPQHRLVTQECAFEWEAMMREGEWIGLYRPVYNVEGYRPGGRAEVLRRMDIA